MRLCAGRFLNEMEQVFTDALQGERAPLYSEVTSRGERRRAFTSDLPAERGVPMKRPLGFASQVTCSEVQPAEARIGTTSVSDCRRHSPQVLARSIGT